MKITKKLVEAAGFVRIKNSDKTTLWMLQWNTQVTCLKGYGKLTMLVGLDEKSQEWTFRIATEETSERIASILSLEGLFRVMVTHAFNMGAASKEHDLRTCLGISQ